MNQGVAELTTVVSYTDDGRICQFIKNLIPVTEADRMKAAARLLSEEKKAALLLERIDTLLERAHAPASVQKPAPAARPLPQQRAAPRAAPVADDDVVVPVRDVLVPARVAAKRKRQEKPDLAAELRKLDPEQ